MVSFFHNLSLTCRSPQKAAQQINYHGKQKITHPQQHAIHGMPVHFPLFELNHPLPKVFHIFQ